MDRTYNSPNYPRQNSYFDGNNGSTESDVTTVTTPSEDAPSCTDSNVVSDSMSEISATTKTPVEDRVDDVMSGSHHAHGNEEFVPEYDWPQPVNGMERNHGQKTYSETLICNQFPGVGQCSSEFPLPEPEFIPNYSVPPPPYSNLEEQYNYYHQPHVDNNRYQLDDYVGNRRAGFIDRPISRDDVPANPVYFGTKLFQPNVDANARISPTCRELGPGSPDGDIPLPTVDESDYHDDSDASCDENEKLIAKEGLYKLVIERLPLPTGTHELAGVTFGIGFAMFYALSIQLRCMAWLLVPTFVGKSGRSYIATFALTMLILGPIQNVILNGKEVTRSLTCVAELAANHTRSRFDLKTKPLMDILTDMKNEGFAMETIGEKIDKKFSPFRAEVFGQKELKKLKKRTKKTDKAANNKRPRDKLIEDRYKGSDGETVGQKAEKSYRKKLDFRCEDIFSGGISKCRHHFNSLFRKCWDKLPAIVDYLCYPLKIGFLCEILKLIPTVSGLNCDARNVVPEGFGGTFTATETMADDLDKGINVNLQYKLEEKQGEYDAATPDEVRVRTMKEFESKQKNMNILLGLVTHLMTFTFILVMIRAYKYHQKYASDIRHDNNYLSAYFIKIDKRRKKQNKRTLLPLKKIESQKITKIKTVMLTSAEIKKVIKGTVMLLVKVMTALIIVMMDQLLYTALHIVSKHSRINYRQTGEHHIKMEVYGDGFMAQIVQAFLKNFDSKHEIDHVSTNYECLPHPTQFDRNKIWPIFAVYGVTWGFMFLESYGLRFRHIIASVFYRKREKRRTLYLYNEMLRRRVGYLKKMRHKVRKQIKQRKLENKVSMYVSFQQWFPRIARCLAPIFKPRDQCLVCEELIFDANLFVNCSTKCGYGYCKDCWIDSKERCYVCLPPEAFEDMSEITSDGFTSSNKEQ